MVALELVSRQAPMSDRIGNLVLLLACAPSARCRCVATCSC
jgi:hypothetical protein